MSTSHRFLPNTSQDQQELLQACGVQSIEQLLKSIPAELRFQNKLPMEERGLSEDEIRDKIRLITQKSSYTQGHINFLGGGVYEHFCPSAVNQITLRGEFLTSYTPYQPEMSQGTLQALFEFQSMVAELFGMEVSNASHYDGSTALAEAGLMAMRLKKSTRRILVSAGVHPEYQQVLKTYLLNLGVTLDNVPLDENGLTSLSATKSKMGDDVAAFIVQSPNFYGCIEDQKSLSDIAKAAGTAFIVNVTEPLSLGILNPPGYYGADIATGEGQSFGLPPSMGGPFVGLFTAHLKDVRQMPGRLCGETVDARGRRSYTLTLSTREQHIRREKATSNICTNQNLMALWATIWLSMLGKNNFKNLAIQNVSKTEYAKEMLLKTGKIKLRYPKAKTFNEFTVDLPCSSADFVRKAVAAGVAPGLALQRFDAGDVNGLLIAVTEKRSRQDIDTLTELIKKIC